MPAGGEAGGALAAFGGGRGRVAGQQLDRGEHHGEQHQQHQEAFAEYGGAPQGQEAGAARGRGRHGPYGGLGRAGGGAGHRASHTFSSWTRP